MLVRERRARIVALFYEHLPAEQAVIMVGRFLAGYTQEEVATELGIPETLVAQRTRAAVFTLRQVDGFEDLLRGLK